MPKARTVEDDLAQELARLEVIKERQGMWEPPVAEAAPAWQTPIDIQPKYQMPSQAIPQMEATIPSVSPVVPSAIPPAPTPIAPTKKPEVPLPFWQRALQVFATPFEWVDENIIKPSLALAGTATGVVKEVERKPGEDFFEWKKRSWTGWQTPGINIDVPWSEDPLRLDVRGVLEFAPWLLMPGAGQVGVGTRAARGVAGALGKISRLLGYAIEYSPWGIVEKTAGAALKAGARGIGKATGGVSGKVGERVFGKMPEPPPTPPVVKEFTKWFDDVVKPAREAFEKEGLPKLRGRQYVSVDEVWASQRRGEITSIEATQLAHKVQAGGEKYKYAVKPPLGKVTPEVTLAGYSKNISDDIVRVAQESKTPSEFNVNLRNYFAREPLKKYPDFVEDLAIGLPELEEDFASIAIEQLLPNIEKQFGSVEKFLTKLAIPKAKGIFSNEQAKELLDIIGKATEHPQVTTDSAWALWNLLSKGDLPQPHHIKQWVRVFGNDFAKVAEKFAQKPASFKDNALDLLNLPRAVLASGDLSGTFRQGLILVLTQPGKFPRAFARQLKAFASEKLSLDMDDALRSHPLYQNAVKDGVEFTALRKGAQMVAKEEPFASNLAQALPFVRRSERAFTTFLNEMRMGSYEAAYGPMKAYADSVMKALVARGASGKEIAKATRTLASHSKLMGNFINFASGRGTLPANLDRYAPVLNTVLFSAKYQMSTLQLPRQIGRMLLSKNPYMRKEAAKAFVTFVGGGTAIVGLFNATGTGKVEMDPRSGDFGKIVVGKTRLDIWRGYVQYARFMAQLLTGESKSAYGNMNKAQRSEIAFRFLQSKASPAFGLMVDLLKGESYMGEPLFNETTGFIKTARDRLVPLALQDVIDAMEQSGVNGLWTAAPATLGIGVLTYVNDLVRVKERIAKQEGYKTWDDIDPKTQREIQNRNVELQTAYLDFDRQVMGTAWGDWRNAGQAVEEVFREDVDLATAQYRKTGDGYTFREKVGDAFTARRGGYASREKEDRFSDIVRRLSIEDVLEADAALGPEQMAIKTYNDALWGDDMYDEFGDYRFDEAEVRKEQLRKQMGEEMFKYVEEYRGLKYETFPREYQELVKAKQILRPYWQVKDEAIKIFGKPKTEWQLDRLNSFISRIRKRLRKTDPETAKYYEMFYARPTQL